MNKIILVGNLTGDPKTNDAGTMTTFALAVDQTKEKTDFLGCKAFGKTGELIASYCKKGQKIFVEGNLRNNNYTDKNGNLVYKNDIVIFNVEFLSKKEEEQQQEVQLQQPTFSPNTAERIAPVGQQEMFEPFQNLNSGGKAFDISDDDLPF